MSGILSLLLVPGFGVVAGACSYLYAGPSCGGFLPIVPWGDEPHRGVFTS
jgi:hypothetical protein